MVRALWPEPNARSVIEPKPAALWLFLWNFQPFAPPDTLDPLVVHRPARAAQQRRDPAVTVATVLPSQLDDVGCQSILISAALRNLALR